MVPICMLKFVVNLPINLKNNDEYFPSEWNKVNVVPIHKKDDTQILKNYRPVSLLSNCAKIFGRIIYNRFLISY